jgi:predicted metal-dependent phosphoesterase TrpH
MVLEWESLHNHTTSSDGTQGALEVLKTAEGYGYGVVALTDHDGLPDAALIERLRDYAGPVKWLVGCEISSGLPTELGGGATSTLHILGLFTDPTNTALLEHCRKARAARTERMEKIVGNLISLGFKITVDDCLRASSGETVGRPHIVRALARYPENAGIIAGLRGQMQAAAVRDAGVAMDYAHMLERPESDHPYRLFLSDDAFVPGIYVDYLYWVDMDSAVGLIRGAGGVAVVAHAYTAHKTIGMDMLEGFVRDGRLDGVEIMGNPLNAAARRAEPALMALASRTGCLATYGADAHRPEDLAGFVADRGTARRTVGQTRQIVERAEVDLAWSNLGA